MNSSRNARAPGGDTMPSRGVRNACIAIAAVAVIFGLHLARPAIVPVLFAVAFALLLSPAVDALQRRRVPRELAAALVVLSVVALFAGCANAVWDPGREWLDSAPSTMRTLERKLQPVRHFLAKVESVSDQAERMAGPAAAPAAPAPAQARRDARDLVASTQEWIVAVVATLVLTYFLLVDGPSILERIEQRMAAGSRRRRMLRLANAVRIDVGRYFSAVTLSSLVLGIGTTLAMYWLGMPSPLLWGAIAFALNFIPYAGPAVTLVMLTVVALVSFDGAGKAVAVACTYLVLTTLEGQILQPLLVGRRLAMSPVAVVLGLWFGGWLWGVAGVVLALPVLVAVKTAVNIHRDASFRESRIASARVAAGSDAAGRLRPPRWRLRTPPTQGRR
jgi:predicted PurR-regulated permease PerM